MSGEEVTNAFEDPASALVAAEVPGVSVEFGDDLIDLPVAEAARTSRNQASMLGRYPNQPSPACQSWPAAW
jgi:hypothetical protein